MQTWVEVVLGILGILAAIAGMFRWSGLWLLKSLDARIEATLDTKLDEKLGPRFEPVHARLDGIDTRLDGIDTRLDAIDTRLDRIDARFDRMDRRMDDFDVKLDHVVEVVDLRLKPLEADMALVKQHLLGSSAA